MDMFLSLLSAWPLAMAFGMISLFLGAFSPSRRIAAMLATVVVMASYLGSNLAGMIASLESIEKLFLFHFYDATAEALENGQQAGDVLVLLAVALVAFGLAVFFFQKRRHHRRRLALAAGQDTGTRKREHGLKGPCPMPFLLIVIIVIALVFDFLNGLHDSSNIVATMISSRAMSPRTALVITRASPICRTLPLWCGRGHDHRQRSGGPGSHQQHSHHRRSGQRHHLESVTWYFGWPSSTSHALIGGLIGAVAVADGL